MADRARREFLKYRERGDCEALGRVFDEVAPKLLLLAMHVVRDRAQAEDVVQETFLRVMGRADRYDSEQPLFPWLVGILQNEARRSRRAGQRTSDPEHLSVPGYGDPFDQASEADLHDHLSRCVSALPKTYRDVLDLRLSRDLPAAAIADALGRPKATVYTQLRRGLELLRQALPAGLSVSAASMASSCNRLPAIRDLIVRQAAVQDGLVPAVTTCATSSSTLGGIVVFKKTLAIFCVGLIALLIPLLLLWGGADPGFSIESVVAAQAGDGGARAEDPAALGVEALPSSVVVEGRSLLAAGAVSVPSLGALCGFTGRILDPDGTRVPGCGVRVYRVAFEELNHLEVPLAGDTISPDDFLAGEAQTDERGVFTISGTPPRGIYLLQGGIGTDNPTHMLVRQTPEPGELVELGDIRLERAAVLEGTVVDEGGSPVASAVVRAADVPAQLLALVPFERFDPQGVMLLRDGVKARVLLVPPWVNGVIEDLPVPATRTDSEGHFRLIGLRPGQNVLAVAKPGYVPILESDIVLEPKKARNLGRLLLQHGERIKGQVVDAQGVPVPGAQVAVAATEAAALVEFGRLIGPTDDDGRFSSPGLPRGYVTVAARRGPDHPWVIADPQRVDRELRLQLPGDSSLTVDLVSEIDAPIESPSLRLLVGGEGLRTDWMTTLGLTATVDLADRFEGLDDGRYRIEGLAHGEYTLLVRSANHAVASVDLWIDQHRDLEVALAGQVHHRISVTDDRGIPIERAAIYTPPIRGGGESLTPRLWGHTDAEGRLTIRQLSVRAVRFTAKHPAFGVAHAEAGSNGEEVAIVMAMPGAIEGELWEGGEPVVTGEYTVLVSKNGSLDMLALGQDLFFSVPDAEGRFRLSGLQAGRYVLRLVQSENWPNSPGTLYSFLLAMEMEGAGVRGVVDVEAGESTHVSLHVDGDSGSADTTQVSGVFMVNGRPATGALIQIWGSEGERGTARVEASGQFLVRKAPTGRATLVIRDMGTSNVLGAVEGSRHTLWHQPLEVTPYETEHIVIDLEMTSLSGTVVSAQGNPIEGAAVRLTGIIPRGIAGSPQPHTVHYNRETDRQGEFRFDQIPVGRYSIGARLEGDHSGSAVRDGIAVEPRLPVQGLQLRFEPAFAVRGRVDLSAFDNLLPVGLHLRFIPEGLEEGSGLSFSLTVLGRVADSGAFQAMGLRPGRYKVRLFRNDGEPLESEGVVVVRDADLDDVVIKPIGGGD